MRPDGRPLGMAGLIGAGLRRSPWQAAAGLLAGLVAAAALVGALSLLQSMGRLLDRGLQDLGGDLVLALPQDRALAERWLATGSTDPVEPAIDVDLWRQRIAAAEILGLRGIEAVDLASGGKGEPGDGRASLLVLRMEFWASPMMAKVAIEEAIPGVAAVVGEQATRHVLTDLQPLARHLSRAAAVAGLGSVLIAGLLTSIRVGQRRAELGMLRAMGASRAYLVGLTVGESGALALAGSLLGGLLTLGLLWAIPATGGLLRHLGVGPLLGLCGLAVAGTTSASCLAALEPAAQAARLDPLEAVRRHR